MKMAPTTHSRRIGFVATRFDGTDGVSLETAKWVSVLEAEGATCFFLSGENDTPAERSRAVPEMHFKHPEIAEIYETSFTYPVRPEAMTRRIHQLKDHIKSAISAYVRDFQLELLIVENALAIPMNVPLGLALTEYIAETGMPAIAHHHDFFWERKRFLVNCVWDYLNMAFPPHLPTIQHVVINSSASNQLSLRTGISGTLVPNVLDFDHPPLAADSYARHLRTDLGFAEDEYLLLQPTRVVQRKGIEHAIELVDRLPVKARLVISHAGGDEGMAYEEHLRRLADRWGVPVSFEADIIRTQRGQTPDGRRVYALADAYHAADVVTYPSAVEGFGNAFLEAIYYRRPIVVNNYSIFATDIRPKGFHVIEFDGFITDDTAWWTARLLRDPSLVEEMTAHNYTVAASHYSYAVLRRHLQALLTDVFGLAGG
jgi:glycosyltransferase involved in cell wall biosynthesis